MSEEEGPSKRQYWLLKTEPGEWSWDDQRSNGGVTNWDGVRNRQAQNNLKAMSLGDLCFFYHSGRAPRVAGVVRVAREWYRKGEGDGDAVVVDVEEVGEMRRGVGLREMKEDSVLMGEVGKGFGVFRQPRLSVVPVPEAVWARVCELGGGYHGDGKVVDDDDLDDDVEEEEEEGEGDD